MVEYSGSVICSGVPQPEVGRCWNRPSESWSLRSPRWPRFSSFDSCRDVPIEMTAARSSQAGLLRRGDDRLDVGGLLVVEVDAGLRALHAVRDQLALVDAGLVGLHGDSSRGGRLDGRGWRGRWPGRRRHHRRTRDRQYRERSTSLARAVARRGGRGDLLLLRHGRTTANAAGGLAGRQPVELDDTGRAQAARGRRAAARAAAGRRGDQPADPLPADPGPGPAARPSRPWTRG